MYSYFYNHANHGLCSPCSGRSTDKTRLEMENLPKGLYRVNAAGTVLTLRSSSRSLVNRNSMGTNFILCRKGLIWGLLSKSILHVFLRCTSRYISEVLVRRFVFKGTTAASISFLFIQTTSPSNTNQHSTLKEMLKTLDSLWS